MMNPDQSTANRRRILVSAWLLGWAGIVAGCSSETEEHATPPAHSTLTLPSTPPETPKESGRVSVHPSNLPPGPPPAWAKDEASLETRDGRRVIVASGMAADAGNRPGAALRQAEARARKKLEDWLEANNPALRLGPTRVVENHIGGDGRAYVRIEAAVPQDS